MAFGEMEATRSIKTEKEQSLKFGEECRETTYVFGGCCRTSQKDRQKPQLSQAEAFLCP